MDVFAMRPSWTLVFLFWMWKSVLWAGTGPATIATIAGNTVGFANDHLPGASGPAASANLFRPVRVFVDGWDNVYVADAGNNRIRMVDAGGTITNLAGNSSTEFMGDGEPAIYAGLFNPSGVFVDRWDHLYIADTAHHRIRGVHRHTGIIATIAGNGNFGFTGDNVPAVNISLAAPSDVYVDNANNIYISDTLNHRIRKVDTSGIITTIAGNGQDGFSGDGAPATRANLNHPGGIYVDKSGNLYIADRRNHRIRKVDASGTITTIAGNGQDGFSGDGGPASLASMSSPRDVCLDPEGNLYIADTDNHRIRKVDASGTITTIAGNGQDGFSGDGGPASLASLSGPQGVCIAGSKLYIADTLNHRIRLVTLPPATPSPDFDGNGSVDFQDFVAFAKHFGFKRDNSNYHARYDLDSDGEIGFSDLVEFAKNFGKAI